MTAAGSLSGDDRANATMPAEGTLFFFFLSSGGWVKIKLQLTTLPRTFIRVVCRFKVLLEFEADQNSRPPRSPGGLVQALWDLCSRRQKGCSPLTIHSEIPYPEKCDWHVTLNVAAFIL